MMSWRSIPLLFACVILAATEVRLNAPLSTRVSIDHPGTPLRLQASIDVPSDAPTDLGYAVWVADRHGRWWQHPVEGEMTPGQHRVRMDLDADAVLVPQGHGQSWNAGVISEIRTAGLVFWSTRSGGRVLVNDLRLDALAKLTDRGPGRMVISDLPQTQVSTHMRLQVRILPDPWPSDPWDPDALAVTLTMRGPNGVSITTNGFHDQPMRAWDRGDREEVQAWGQTAIAVRSRATSAGTWQSTIEARWRSGATARADLPTITASGTPGDGIARVDTVDSRFFSADGDMVWPIGPNIHTVWDLRGVERTGTRLTPDRGTLSYRAWFDRMAAAGANGCEIWLSSWNLALEWNAAWWPWRGQGRISEERAWQLDRVLDLAEERGIRVNLVVNNHGQASIRTDAEWDRSPANRDNGGWLDDPADWFDDPKALAAQERSRRHLTARYGDSPAILGWKLWSEVNLTELGHRAGGGEGDDAKTNARALMRSWHAEAAVRWAANDPWRHPCTTHWAGNYHTPDRDVAALPGIAYVCIDAYHGPDGPPVWTWLCRSTSDPARRSNDGLAELGKPILVTEYGGNWDAAPQPQLEVALAVGGWVGLVSGHAGTPMIWWHEWLDQGNRFGQYQALSRFLKGEDLRNPLRRSIVIDAGPRTWSRAWAGPGRMLGYILDETWGRSGGPGDLLPAGELVLGESVAAGAMQLSWWDADTGLELSRQSIDHPGDRLAVPMPGFQRHLAFKAWR